MLIRASSDAPLLRRRQLLTGELTKMSNFGTSTPGLAGSRGAARPSNRGGPVDAMAGEATAPTPGPPLAHSCAVSYSAVSNPKLQFCIYNLQFFETSAGCFCRSRKMPQNEYSSISSAKIVADVAGNETRRRRGGPRRRPPARR